MSKADGDSSTRVPLRANLNKLPDGEDEHFYWDRGEGSVPGFALYVRRSGARILNRWIIQYRAAGKAPRQRLGNAEVVSEIAARKAARKIRAQVELGGDPQREKAEQRGKDLIKLLRIANDYVAYKKPSLKPNSYAMLHHYLIGPIPGTPHKNWRSKRNVESWLKPCHGTPAYAVTKADISLALKKAEESSGTPSAIALRSATSSMFAWAIREGCYGVDKNPVIDARKIEVDVDDEESDATGRVLSEGELVKIWKGVDPDSDYGRIMKLLILSCCRRGEIGGMRWSEIDDPQNPTRIEIPPERLKNAKQRRKKKLGPLVVPVTPLMAQIITKVPMRAETDYLFGGRGISGFTSWSRYKRALDKKIRIPEWKHHHLRRNTTHLADLGTPPHIVEEILGHTSGGTRDSTARRYNRSNYPAEVRAALEMWSLHILELVQRDPKMFNERTREWPLYA